MSEAAQKPQEWPKWIKGRIAANPSEGRFLLAHTAECGVHLTVIVEGGQAGQQRLRDRHPDHDRACTCGGVEPTDEEIEAAGLGEDPGPFNGADPAKFDHDGDGAAGGSLKHT